MDYTTLIAGKSTTGSICSFVNSDKVPATNVVADAEEWMGRFLRVRRMQARAPLTLSEGESEIGLSSELPNFLDPIRMHMHGYGDMLLIPEDDIDRMRATDSDGVLASGTPCYWTVTNRTVLFDCEAIDDYSLVLLHYAKPEALSASNTTNLYTEEWHSVFRLAAMAFSYIFLKDEKRAAAMFQSALGMMNQGAINDDMARRGMSFKVTVS